MFESYLTRLVDIVILLSNLFFFIPFVGAIRQKRWTRAWIFFWMIWISFTYHLCKSFGVCLFTSNQHSHLDFFFAQLLIILTALYFVAFSRRYPWVERGLIILGAIAVVILQITLNSDLIVQASLVGASVFFVLLYWFLRGSLPTYNMVYMTLGLSLIVGSVSLYTYQDI